MGFTLSTKDLATANASEYDQIKSVLEPFRQIFMNILENAENDCVSHFTIDQTYNPAIITLHPANGDTFSVSAKGRAAFPPSIPYDMQTAILKFNQCDLSVLSFLCWIRDALRPICATADWLMIVPVRALSILHYSDEEPVTKNGRHSVFAITTASREQYIADFTLEQLGYPAELWFLQKAEYFTRFVEAGASWHIASAEDMDDAHCDIAECDIQQPIRTRIDAVCKEINWPGYYKLSAEDRIPWLEARTRETVGRLEAEDELDSTLEAA
ncbi:hypothetical protein IG631_11503 [Alternaria alternata]|nr:hypothetical protein IG631_11503 [Alternaria alternata]